MPEAKLRWHGKKQSQSNKVAGICLPEDFRNLVSILFIFTEKQQYGMLWYNKIFFVVNFYFKSISLQVNGKVAIPALKREMFGLLLLPYLIGIFRNRNGVAGACFYHITCLYRFLFLYSRGKVEPGFGDFIR